MRAIRVTALLVVFASTAAGVGIAAGLALPRAGIRDTTYGCSSAECTAAHLPTNLRRTSAKPEQRPVGFLEHVVRLLARNDYRAAYPLLHPEQRRLLSADEYVACEQMSPVPGTLSSLRVLDSRRERISVAGAGTQRVISTAVHFELKIVGTIPAEAVTIDLTAHAVSVAGRWAWILSARRLALHRSGTCGVVAN